MGPNDGPLDEVLRRLAEPGVISCRGEEFEIWRDFDSDETRIRLQKGLRPVRIDEDALSDYLHEHDIPVTDAAVRQLFCRVCVERKRAPFVISKNA